MEGRHDAGDAPGAATAAPAGGRAPGPTAGAAPAPASAPAPGPGVATRPLVGHLLRRCHQVHNVLWAQEVGGVLTSPQFSVLSALAGAEEGLDQHALGALAGLDRSTTAGVVRRLQAQGWLRRDRDPRDGRRQVITITTASRVALSGLAGAVGRVQERFLAPLTAAERGWFTDRLALLADPTRADPDRRPGHLVRRAQQRHAALWAEELGGVLTGPQFAVLDVLRRDGAQGQGPLAEASAVDRSSASDVLARLEARGWTRRTPDPADRRTRRVALTPAGEDLLREVGPGVLRVQRRILEPVDAADRDRLEGLLATVSEGVRVTLAHGTGGQ
ncbi:MarR family transcriptional regulator [Citricoccus sp. SGAir0253]|uniref:MarR family winged helix-turn-helix transcriptional regulator n=1 Tax=Citricoccus sp. SGAir0253 TaxID=2567881 RepID=UPI0010CD613E|nr:MarR family transcriptional regulator [Citricoccus sp. SGAir0253]QCU77813.1 MarR family transcriptional regulator [Citricoccus sp. SGAir0253]